MEVLRFRMTMLVVAFMRCGSVAEDCDWGPRCGDAQERMRQSNACGLGLGLTRSKVLSNGRTNECVL